MTTSTPASGGPHGRAVALGAGGAVGTAWMAGLVVGLHEAGVDLAEADLFIGTSAGAIVGALLASGQDCSRLATPARAVGSQGTPPQVDGDRLGEVFAVLRDTGLTPAEKRPLVGRLAHTAATGPEQAHITRMGAMVGTDRWPDRKLLITAVDAGTGESEVFDGASGAPLSSVVAASTAFPGIYPPITINDRRYMDGGLRSGTSADLAVGARVLVVIEPMAHLLPREPLTQELAQAGSDAVVTIGPDEETAQVFGRDLHDRAAWQPAYRAGVRQAGEAAERIRATWHNPRQPPRLTIGSREQAP
ncbi:patatin-like phospholipase family protein [Streptomyces sp. NPDC060064]|uniref:patatin-like phospholipase family protein n=1 Tax=Streptomyces sp. NPDC060064 TaxID=3347049 RepID=UPI0036C60C68